MYVCMYVFIHECFSRSIYVYTNKQILLANTGAVLDMLLERAVNSSIVKWSPNVEDCGNSFVNRL